jgi:putative ubiquitin-RnfH superfamily antitoxin RatB of RatAB toxin-antitoxin module
MASPETIRIEVVYPLPNEQLLFEARVPDQASIRDGIAASGILGHYPELVMDNLEAGIFGKLAKLDDPLRDRDRIEIYRPLIADPKAVRKQRAAEGKRMKKGGGDAGDDA